MVLATEEKALLAFEPTRRIVPTTNTNITASITAYSAMSCPLSSDQSWGRILICLEFLSIAKLRTLGWNANATEDRARLDKASELSPDRHNQAPDRLPQEHRLNDPATPLARAGPPAAECPPGLVHNPSALEDASP